MNETEKNIYTEAAQISSTIKIYGAPNNTSSDLSPQIDEIDANAVETFTLEELRSLILNYRKKDKDFLIARVTTPDPDNGSLFYNFYYAAAEINRVLFKFEANRRLLHRMKVKNPLNNMFIVGQVFYYKISKYEIDKSIVNYFFNQKNEIKNSRKAFSAILKNSPKLNTYEKKSKSKDCFDINVESSITHVSGKTPGEIIEGINRSKISVPTEMSSERKICYGAKYFASDDDFLMKSEVRDYFRQNALDPEDEFLYEIDRTQNDFLALLDDMSETEDDDISDWRRIFSAHITLATGMLILCLLLGGGPLMALVFFPIAMFLFLSFLLSLFYVLFCRRSTFETIAVESMDTDSF